MELIISCPLYSKACMREVGRTVPLESNIRSCERAGSHGVVVTSSQRTPSQFLKTERIDLSGGCICFIFIASKTAVSATF